MKRTQGQINSMSTDGSTNSPSMRHRHWLLPVIPFLFYCGTASGQLNLKNPAAEAAVRRGAEFLKTQGVNEEAGRLSLAAMTLVKIGEPPTTPVITKAIEEVQAKVKEGEYRPLKLEEHTYEAGVDLMLLVEADAQTYRLTIEAIVRYLLANQRTDGAWDYFPPRGTTGDTSQTQYAALGFWSATRAGIPIPDTAWAKMAHWHVKTQWNGGGFSYHPGGGKGQDNGPEPGMTVAGASSVAIAKMHLFSGSETYRKPKSKKSSSTPFGVLEKINFDSPESNSPASGDKDDTADIGTVGDLDRTINGAMGWMVKHYTIDRAPRFHLYYLYGLERMAALTNVEKIGSHDWYTEGTAYLLRSQQKDGSWQTQSGSVPGTSFAILFITRATARTLDHSPKKESVRVGDGLLSGGRGLPDDLSQAETRDGTIQERKIDTPLDKLLSDLTNPQMPNVESAQAQLVQEVQLGNREALIGQKDLLLKLVKDPRVEARRTAVWVLGRCEDLRLGRVLIESLEDPDLDVAIEARNALCTLSRRPLGFGLPDAPAQVKGGVPDEAAIQKWKSEAVKRWREWYRSVQPYDERDGLSDVVPRQ